jgi:hypothetical protein
MSMGAYGGAVIGPKDYSVGLIGVALLNDARPVRAPRAAD